VISITGRLLGASGASGALNLSPSGYRNQPLSRRVEKGQPKLLAISLPVYLHRSKDIGCYLSFCKLSWWLSGGIGSLSFSVLAEVV